MNSVFSSNKDKKTYFSAFLASGFCPENLAFARKIMVLPESVGCSPLARTPMFLETLAPVLVFL